MRMVGVIDAEKVLPDLSGVCAGHHKKPLFGVFRVSGEEAPVARRAGGRKALTNDRIGSIFSGITLANADLILH